MKSIIAGLLTTYTDVGQGRTVVLLHGWGDTAAGLAGLQHDLASTYRVIAVDLPGFGGSALPPKVWSLDDYARFIAAWLTKIEVTDLYAIIGHSNGGAIAIRGLAQGTLVADKLILLASAGVRFKQPIKRSVYWLVAKVGKLVTAWLPADKRGQLRRKLYRAAASDALVAPELRATFQQIVRQDVRQDAAQLHLPTLLINGDQDQAVPLKNGQLLQSAIAGSQLIVLPAVGHFVQHDAPAEVSRAIKEFLA